MMGRRILIPNKPNEVCWTQLYGVFNKRKPASARQYHNTLQMTNAAPIGANTDPATAVVTQNQARALLIIQNLSTAVAPDTAPVMYFGFGTSPAAFANLALPPGVGIVLDVRVPTDAIYCAIGSYSNTGGSVLIQGIISEGTVTNPETDTVNISETGQLQEMIRLLRKLVGEPAPSPADTTQNASLSGSLVADVFW